MTSAGLNFIPLFLLCALGVFWIFVLWLAWTIAQSLKGIDLSLKRIANELQTQKHGQGG